MRSQRGSSPPTSTTTEECSPWRKAAGTRFASRCRRAVRRERSPIRTRTPFPGKAPEMGAHSATPLTTTPAPTQPSSSASAATALVFKAAPSTATSRRASPSGKDGAEALGLQHLDHHIAMIALNLDHAILHRAADAAALLECPRELLQRHVVDRH